MTDERWYAQLEKLAPAWMRRGCATPEDVAALRERGQCSWSRQRLLRIAIDVSSEPIPLHWRPLWWRRRHDQWGERAGR